MLYNIGIGNFTGKELLKEIGMQEKLTILKKYYGYDSFRPGQEEIIDNIIAGRDIMAVMPTGAGKSICYQIPAILLTGITLVISPLISLMLDQVTSLNQNGIRAAYLNSTLTAKQMSLALQRAAAGTYKIIYVAPERLSTESFRNFAANADISLVAVDEAHCVSQWGHDFRPSYTEIAGFVASLHKRPVVAAFTATATELVKSDVKSLLGLQSPFEVTTGFDRPNLYFGVRTEKNPLEFVCNYVAEHSERSGIIYAMTRKAVEKIHDYLRKAGFPVAMYHAGLEDYIRSQNQEDFISDRKPVMVATNAFGMGIDKPDVGFIIHYNMPLSMESYYQEAGRAGRDGSEAECILLYSKKDIMVAKYLIDNSVDESEPGSDAAATKAARYEKLEKMIDYCESTDCLRSYILRYFGETPAFDSCGKCSSCNEAHVTADVTFEVRCIYNAITSTNERFGLAFITDFLHGDDNARISGRFVDLPAYASLSDKPRSRVRDIIERLISAGLLKRSDGQYPILSVTPEFDEFIASRREYIMRFRSDDEDGRKKRSRSGHSKNNDSSTGLVDAELFEKLRAWRREASAKRSIPAYSICTDQTLRSIAAKKPKNKRQLSDISGVGEVFMARYGEKVLEIISERK